MEQYIIYFDPSDYPDQYVVRRVMIDWRGISSDPNPWHVGSDLEGARDALPSGLYRLSRLRGDEPQIVEVWL